MKKLIAILGLCSGFAAHAQIPQPDPDTTAIRFLIVSSIKNLQEISAAEQAVQKAKNPELRAFAQMMIKDHGQAEQQLLAFAKSQGIQLPPAATGGIKPDLLLTSTGHDFDKVYVHGMVAGHNNSIQTFEAYTINGKDPAVRAFAQQMLPTLKAHLAAIKGIDEKIKDQVAK